MTADEWERRREVWRSSVIGETVRCDVAANIDATTVLSGLKAQKEPNFAQAIPLPTMITALHLLWQEEGVS